MWHLALLLPAMKLCCSMVLAVFPDLPIFSNLSGLLLLAATLSRLKGLKVALKVDYNSGWVQYFGLGTKKKGKRKSNRIWILCNITDIVKENGSGVLLREIASFCPPPHKMATMTQSLCHGCCRQVSLFSTIITMTSEKPSAAELQ